MRKSNTRLLLMNGLELTRHHVSPRVHKFLPEGVRGFPTSLRNLNSTRKTMGEAYFGKEVFVVRDERMDEDPYQEPFSQAWTGKTVHHDREGRRRTTSTSTAKEEEAQQFLWNLCLKKKWLILKKELYRNSWSWRHGETPIQKLDVYVECPALSSLSAHPEMCSLAFLLSEQFFLQDHSIDVCRTSCLGE